MTTIELTGMVGAGKTTVAELLRAELRADGFDVWDMKSGTRAAMRRSFLGALVGRSGLSPAARERVLTMLFKGLVRPSLMIRLVLREPRFVWSLFAILARSPLPLRHRTRILGLTVRPAAAAPFVLGRLRPEEVLLLEEGLVHRAVNLFAWTPAPIDEQAVWAYLARIPVSDLVVRVDAPIELCVERVRSRGLPLRLRDRDEASVQRFIDGAAAVVGVISSFLTEIEAQSVVIDNGGQDTDGVREALRRLLADAELDHECRGPCVPRATTPRFVTARRWAVPRPHRPAASARPTLGRDVVDEVLSELGLSATGESRAVPGQSRADNVIVPTSSGRMLLKRYKSTVSAAGIEHEHRVLRHLQEQQFPSPRLHATADGRTVIETGGRYYAAFDHEDAYFHYHEYVWLPRHRRQLVALSGGALAGLHAALADLSPETTHPLGFISLDGPRLRELDWYVERLTAAQALTAGTDRDEEERRVRADVHHKQRAVIDRIRGLDEDLRRAHPPRQVIHGDYGPYNILFKAGEPVLIVDFEMARLDWRIIDVAKSAGQFAFDRFGFRPDRFHDFLSGYRRTCGPDADDLGLLNPVWQFLHLRRVIVCWTRYYETRDVTWLRESERKLDLADVPIGDRVAPADTR